MPWPGGRGGTLSASRVLLHITVSDPEVQGTSFFLSFLTYCCTQSPADTGLAMSGSLKTGVSVRASIMQVRLEAAAQQPPWRWSQLDQTQLDRPGWKSQRQKYKTKQPRFNDVGFVGFKIQPPDKELIHFQITLSCFKGTNQLKIM